MRTYRKGPEDSYKTQDCSPSLHISAAAGNQTRLNIIQRAPLAMGKLNVIGEHHSESNVPGVREKEKALCSEKIGSDNYWREFEFRVGPAPVFRDKRRRGDPLMPRIRYCITSIKDGMPRIAVNAANVAILINPVFFQIQGLFIGNLKDDYDNFRKFFSDRGSELTDAERVAYDGLYADVETLMNYYTILQAGKDLASFNSFKAQVDKLFTKLNAVTVALRQGVLNPDPEVHSKARSKGMDQAAEASAGLGVTGGWKIGESHSDDITNLIASDPNPLRNYTLVSRNEFYHEYDAKYPLTPHPK